MKSDMAWGGEMNQWYKSTAVYKDNKIDVPQMPATEHERTLHHIESTYPGYRVPHAWLSVPIKRVGPRPPMVLTRDLYGHGRFTILTGIGGKPMWASAADRASEETGVEIKVYGIVWGQDYEEAFSSWFDKHYIEEKGAVFVRPDRTVAWRCKTPPADEQACGEKLTFVLRRVLGFKERLADEDKDSLGSAVSGLVNGSVNGQQPKQTML